MDQLETRQWIKELVSYCKPEKILHNVRWKQATFGKIWDRFIDILSSLDLADLGCAMNLLGLASKFPISDTAYVISSLRLIYIYIWICADGYRYKLLIWLCRNANAWKVSDIWGRRVGVGWKKLLQIFVWVFSVWFI